MMNKQKKKQSKRKPFIQQQLRTIPEELMIQQQKKYQLNKKNNNKFLTQATTQAVIQNNNQSDFDDDDNRQNIFINAQQQKIIKSILQLCRKGKITSKNAFQIPLKTLGHQINPNNLKFWRMASQILGTNITIYDKRIQNFSGQAQKVNGSIMRSIQSKNDEIDENIIVQKQNIHLKLTFKQYTTLQNMNKINVGVQTLQRDPSKLDIQNSDNQFLQDPIYSKISKMFDESSSKGLLLNCFNLSKKKQIKLFADQDQKNEENQINLVNKNLQININLKGFGMFNSISKFGQQIDFQYRKIRSNDLEGNSRFQIMGQLTQNDIQIINQKLQINQFQQPNYAQSLDGISIQNINEESLSINQMEIRSNTLNINKFQRSQLDSFFQLEQHSIKQTQLGKGIPQLFTFSSPWDMPNRINKKKHKLKPILGSKNQGQIDQKISKNKKNKLTFNINFTESTQQTFLSLKLQNSSKIKDFIKKNNQIKYQQKNVNRISSLQESYPFRNLTLKPIIRNKHKSQGTLTNLKTFDSENKFPIMQAQFTFNQQLVNNNDYQGPSNQINRRMQPDNQEMLIISQKKNTTFFSMQSQSKNKNNSISIKQFKVKVLKQIQDHGIKSLFDLHKKEKQVNIQTKFLTLLHLANENNFLLTNYQEDTLIQI